MNIATDAAAYHAGFWRYTEVTTSFGPLGYYVVAGFGCGGLALVMLWLRRRGNSVLGFLAFWAVYAPLRDFVVARATHLIEFHYRPVVVVVIADSLSGFVIPVLVAYGVISLFVFGEEAHHRALPAP